MRISDWSSDVCSSDLRGTSLVEIFQNCIVYNDGAFEAFTERSVAADRQLLLEHGKPMIFGKDADKGLRLAKGKLALEVVTLGDGITEADLLVHDEADRAMAFLLAAMQPRWEERRVGKKGVSTCRYRWVP